jgi:hypothetical protein
MQLLAQLFDFILHIDKHLGEIIAADGNWTYTILLGGRFAPHRYLGNALDNCRASSQASALTQDSPVLSGHRAPIRVQR